MRADLIVFLSGRVMTLLLLICFQILTVRILVSAEFAAYAMVFALATLMQTIVSFGIPRIISRYVGQAGWGIQRRVIARLLVRLLLVRVAGTTAILFVAYFCANAFGLLNGMTLPLLVVGALFIIVGVVQIDADNAAQALALQKTSRSCSIGESAARLLGVAALAATGHIDSASDILLVSVLTTTAAATRLFYGVLGHLRGEDQEGASPLLDASELKSTAIAGYASTLAWFASSPAVIRLIGGATLNLVSFAGFAFVQGLVVSFQRYTPGAMLFPFIEPTVMREYSRTGYKSPLETALSLTSKIDMIVIGAAIVGTLIAARPLVELMTGGKYGDMAYAIPWLLLYVVTIPIYRSFEIVSVLVGATSTMAVTLIISIFWGLLTYVLAQHYGPVALLAGPLGDAFMRISYLQFMLRRMEIREAVDTRMLFILIACIGLAGLIGSQIVAAFKLEPVAMIGTGALMAILYLAAMFLIRPFHLGEAELLTKGSENGTMSRAARRLTQL